MTWAAAVAAANRAIVATFGVRCTYVAGTNRREITAAPGDITAQALGDGVRVVVRQTCIWSIRRDQLAALLGGAAPKRGHRIEVANPEIPAGVQTWTIEHDLPDEVAGTDGWVVSTYLTDTASVAAPNAERVA